MCNIISLVKLVESPELGKASIGVDTTIHWLFDFLVRRSICICTIKTSRSFIFRLTYRKGKDK